MSDSIPLSLEHGLRPVITTCPRCGGKSDEIALVGAGRVYTCSACGRQHLGYRRPKKCEDCEKRSFTSKEYDETIPIMGGLCSSCKKEVEEHKEIVAQGGVYWQCEDCGAGGVIKGSSEFAQAVRAAHGLEAPAPCGVAFSKTSDPPCPACGEELE